MVVSRNPEHLLHGHEPLTRDSESETFDHVISLAGECIDRLFESVYFLRPVADFREEVSEALPKRDARQLIELCQTKCSPRVSFETAETKTAEH
jgi:hypothetical protein